jgi:hypothetical protein
VRISLLGPVVAASVMTGLFDYDPEPEAVSLLARLRSWGMREERTP